MAQTRLVASGVSSQGDADKIVNAGEAVKGVKFINVRVDDGVTIITHGDDFDLDAFKSAVKTAGFDVS